MTTAPRTTPLGRRLYLARAARGWSLTQAACALDTSASTVHRWETGERVPSIKAIARLAAAYELRVRDLVLCWEPRR